MRARLGALALGLVAALAMASAATSPALALDDARLSYATITTPHFNVHYPEHLEPLARRSAQLCEEAHLLLVPLLDWTTAQRTEVVVTDRLDAANGSANVYGRNIMRLYGMPPESDSVLGYYDDWLRLLIIHEYVHVLHLDTASGVAPYVNAVIGKQLNPNQTMPRWYTEGLAVYHESARTGAGRVGSALYRMWLRTEALRGEHFTLGQVTGSPTRWPFGNAAYLFGAFFLDYIARHHGADALTRFNHLYGSRLIPWSMNQAMRELVGASFDTLWQRFVAESQGRAMAERVAVMARGRTPLTWLTRGGGSTKYPRLGPGPDEVTFLREPLERHATFATVKAHSGEPDDLFRVDAPMGPGSWTPDGALWIYNRGEVVRSVYQYQDLYAWDRARDTHRRLTTFERAREPAISPDGKSLAYVRVVDGTMELVTRALDGASVGPARVLISGKQHAWDDERRWQQLATPVFSLDGRAIVFSWWRSDRRSRDLWRYDLTQPAAQALSPLTQDAAMALDPSFGPDGTLYYASDQGGIYNIHAMSLETGERWQVTEVVTGAFSPQVSRDGRWLYMSVYHEEGYDLARAPMPTRRMTPTSATTLVIPRDYPLIDTSTWTQGDYAPLSHLAPLLFTPDVAALIGGFGFGATVTGYDPAERHSYQLSASLVQNAGAAPGLRPNASLSYSFGGWPISVSVVGAHQRYTRSNSLFAQSQLIPYLEQQSLGRLSLSYPISSVDDNLSLSVSYSVDHRGYAERPQLNPEPGDLTPIPAEIGWFNALTLGVVYSNLERYAMSVSVEEGVSAAASVSAQSPALGSDYQSLNFQFALRGYLPNPWIPRHTFAAGWSGGFIDTNFRARNSYSVGGQLPQDVLTSLVLQTPTGNGRVRGYAPFVLSGDQYASGGVDYRFPIWDLEQGFSTVPVFLRQIKGRVFMDVGTAYSGMLADATWLTSVGGEVQLSAIFGYYLPGNLTLGYAYGLDPTLGQHDMYLLYGGGY